MTVCDIIDIIAGIATVIATVFAALSYFNSKDDE